MHFIGAKNTGFVKIYQLDSEIQSPYSVLGKEKQEPQNFCLFDQPLVFENAPKTQEKVVNF